MDLNVQFSQRRQQPQHTAGNVLDASQIERQVVAVVELEQFENLFAAHDQVNLIGLQIVAKPNDGQGAGFINTQGIMMNRHGC